MKAILSDTVGFVSQLPHELIAAFHATLEEVLQADLILHVRNGASEDFKAQKTDVLHVLKEIGALDEKRNIPIVEVINKIDLMKEAYPLRYEEQKEITEETTCFISALSGEGLETLKERMIDLFEEETKIVHMLVDAEDKQILSWLQAHGKVSEYVYNEKEHNFDMTVALSEKNQGRFQKLFKAHTNRKRIVG